MSPASQVECFKKWKGTLSVVGTGEIPDIESSFSRFSPTVAFSAVRMLVVLTVDPRFCVESYDLSGAFFRNRAQRSDNFFSTTG
jgi:hypothetical protein